jgi:RNA polymerase sigma-70 factor (ECF subfamily)
MILILQGEVVSKSTFNNKQAYTEVEDLYKQCFHEYFEKLHGYAFTIVEDNAEAKDIVQAAFIKLWEKRQEINLSIAARSYLYTTVYHLSLNTVRNNKIRASHHEYITPPTVTGKIHTAEEREIKARISQAINSLPPRCKEVFCKSRLEGKKYAEIATDLGISIKTVEVQMGKALKTLREQLADLALTWIIYLFI